MADVISMHVHDVPGYERFIGYRVLSDGRIETQKKRGGASWIIGDAWKELRGTRNCRSGYWQIGLADGTKVKTVLVHHLVMAAFGPPKPFPGAWRLHKDDNKDNNDISNLYWGTPKQNSGDRDRNGHHNSVTGEDHPDSKLTEDQVRMVIASDKTDTALAQETGVTPSAICMIRSGHRWKHIPGKRKRSTWDRRASRNRSSANAKLSDDQVRDIYRRVHAGENQDCLAREYGLTQQNISNIKRAITYRRVTQ